MLLIADGGKIIPYRWLSNKRWYKKKGFFCNTKQVPLKDKLTLIYVICDNIFNV